MILINGKSPKITLFPDGTKLIRSEMITKIDTAIITWKYDSDEELFQLQCIVDALRSRGCKSLELIMPYIPNARMDRIKSEDEVFTLKTFANIINVFTYSCEYQITTMGLFALLSRFATYVRFCLCCKCSIITVFLSNFIYCSICIHFI